MASKDLTFDIFGRDRSASKTIRGVGDEIDRSGGRFSAFKATAALALAGVAAGLVKFGTDSVQAYAAAQESQMELQSTLDRFPRLADTNIESLGRLNTALMDKTRFDDDAIASGQAVLGQFELTGKQLETLTPLMLDYAQKTGKDLPTAAGDLGKALLGQGRALKEVGIDFEDTGSAAGNFDALVAGLRGQVGGFAEESATTVSGKLDNLRNKFGEIQEKVGEELMPVLEGALDWMSTDGVAAVEDLTGVLGDLKSGLEDISEEDWFKGLTDALGEGGSLDLVKGGAFEAGGIFGPPVNPDFSDWDATFGLVGESARRGFGGAWDAAEEETNLGVDSVRGGMGGGFSLMGMDMDVFRAATGERFRGTWADANQQTVGGFGTIGGSTGTGLAGMVGQLLGFVPTPAAQLASAWLGANQQTVGGFGTIGGSTGSGLGGLLAQLLGFSPQPGAQMGTAWSGANSQTVGGWGSIVGSTRTGVGNVGGEVGRIPGVVRGPFNGLDLYSAGVSIVGSLVSGIRSMIGAAARAAGEVMSAVAGVIPHSPAKTGPFSGSGWTAVAKGGAALREQFLSGFDDIGASRGQMEALVASPAAAGRGMRVIREGASAGSAGVFEEHIHVHVDGKEVATAIRRYERGLR